MSTCPLLFIANKSSKKNTKKNTLKHISHHSNCCGKECSWFDQKNKNCIITKLPHKLAYIKKTLGCI